MAYFTTSIAVVAGLCLAFGILYLFIGVRRPSDRTVNLLFAFFALAYAGAIITARSTYLANTLDAFAAASRASTFFSAIGFSLLTWFVAAYTGARSRVLLWIITGAFAIVGAASIFFPDLVVDVSGGVESITFPWGETVLMIQAETAPLMPILILGTLAMIGYIAVADIQMFRRGDRGDATVLAVGIGWFIFTLVEEILVIVGAFDAVFLSDFGFLGFVLAMGLQMVNKAIETEEELLDYRTNLVKMVEVRSAQLTEAQAQLLAQAEEQATTAERSRLARELHDVITQLLFSINLIAGSLPRLWRRDPDMAERSTGELQRLTRGALAEMRTLLRELRPYTITETDLATLVTHLSDGLAARHDIPATVHVDMTGSLPQDVHLAIYRITQEALNNVAKHANASSLSVGLIGTASRVNLAVVDDGYGFEATDISAGSMGLDIMRERADEIGAELAISSEQDIGTTVELTWHARAIVEQT
ncbi:MAG: sensor histidine kinase [Acidimicrobiia bacterium]